MKTILQKHTSKFVVNLLNGLGITACVALTSCGDQDKSKQTENQVENLKNGLKNVEFYKNLADDEDSLKAIADWLNNKNYGSDHILTENELREIFQYDSSKLNEVAEKLGVELTVFEEEPDDEKKKEINEWLNKLNSRNDDDFNALDNDLKEKVAQKFIDNNIDITNDDDITTKLAGFINEVKDEKKQNEISIEVVGEGKVTITKVADSTPTDFVFGTFDVFEKFVGDLKGKEITGTEVSLSFAFEGEKVKICGHQTGFKVTDCFDKFLNCFEGLIKIKNFKVSNLSLKIDQSTLSLNAVQMSDGYFKTVEFWTLVKDHADLFGITEKNKFEIVKNGNDENTTVKINDFAISLQWNNVVGGENTFKEDAGWDKIFKLKSDEEPKEVVGDENKVTIEWSATQGYKLGDNSEFVKIESLDTLRQLVGDLNNKTVKELKGDFTLKFDGKNVKVCGGENIDLTTGANFETLLGYVDNLRNIHKAINSEFKIDKIGVSGNNKVKFGESGLEANVWNNSTFWKAVKTYQDLFNGLPIAVEKNKDNNKGKIGQTVINVEMFSGKDIAQEWKEIFKKK